MSPLNPGACWGMAPAVIYLTPRTCREDHERIRFATTAATNSFFQTYGHQSRFRDSFQDSWSAPACHHNWLRKWQCLGQDQPETAIVLTRAPRRLRELPPLAVALAQQE